MGQQKYFKRNYIEPLKIITPGVYFDKDEELFGLQKNSIANTINSHIKAADNIHLLFPQLSSTDNFPDITSIGGIAPFFVKQVGYGDLSPTDFQINILSRLGKNLSDFSTSSDFANYISESFLPSIELGSETLHSNTLSAFDNTLSGTHEYLLRHLDWMFLLNSSGLAESSYSPSSYVVDKLVNNIYFGKTLNLVDGLVGFQEYVWRNWDLLSGVAGGSLLPENYYSSVGDWTDGTQQLEKLKTLVEIIYSSEYSDSTDRYVLHAFQNYINVGSLLDDLESAGPFSKLLKAISFSVADRNAEVNKLNALLDIEKCPEEYLPFLADQIGWKLIGNNVSKWRKQLRSAATIYKAKGTKKALRVAVDSVYTSDALESFSTIKELWESYIPNLLYYLLLTDTKDKFTQTNFEKNTFTAWTEQIATSLGVLSYSHSDSDTNVRLVVDTILFEAVERYPDLFYFNGKNYPFGASEFVFKYRDRIFGIPPWEEEKFYRECFVTDSLLTFFRDKLVFFGVSEEKATAFYDYCKTFVLSVEDTSFLGGAYIFFTSGQEYPPNYSEITNNLSADKLNLVGLWSGKSSHVDLSLSAGGFDLGILSQNVSDQDLFFQSLKILDTFAPAHAILNTKLLVSGTESVSLSGLSCAKIEKTFSVSNSISEESDIGGDSYNLGSDLGGGTAKGADMSVLDNSFRRDAIKSYTSPAINITDAMPISPQPFGSGGIGRSSRRRKTFPLNNDGSQLYLRDGRSMPIILNPSDTGISDFLGFIPLEGDFQSVSSHNNLPPVYDFRENLKSPHTYFGVDVSNTYPCRGISSLYASSCHPYSLRGETPLIWATLNELMRAKNYQKAKKQYDINLNSEVLYPNNYAAFDNWKDVIQSIANSYSYPDNIEDYEHFEYGSNLHELFNYFSQNPFTLQTFINYLTSVNFALFNGDFSILGSSVDVIPDVINDSFVDTFIMSNENVFRSGIEASGTISKSYPSETPFQDEYVNSNILSSVNIVGASDSLDNISAGGVCAVNISNQQGHYLQDNPVICIEQFSPASDDKRYSRISFSLSSITDGINFLTPESEYEIKIKFGFLIEPGNDQTTILGLRSFIHLDYEENSPFWYLDTHTDRDVNGLGWTTPDYTQQQWKVLSDTTSLSNDMHSVLNSNNTPATAHFEIWRQPMWNNYSPPQELDYFEENNVLEATFKFKTTNNSDNIENYTGTPLHSTDRDYIFNFFGYSIVNAETSYTLVLDSVDITNLTLGEKVNIINKYTVPNFDSGEDETYVEYIDLTPEHILNIFRYWKQVSTSVVHSRAGGSGYVGPEGGSRINNRTHPEWYNNITTNTGSNNQYTEITLR